MPFLSQMPGNVIHLDYNEDHRAFMKQLVDLLREGNMIMVDYHNPILYRYDEGQLGMVYMRADDENDWLPSESNPLNAYINGSMQAFFVKSSDIHYTHKKWRAPGLDSDFMVPKLERLTFHLKYDEEWYSLDYNEDDNTFFVPNPNAPELGLYNAVKHNLVEADVDHTYESWDKLEVDEDANPWSEYEINQYVDSLINSNPENSSDEDESDNSDNDTDYGTDILDTPSIHYTDDESDESDEDDASDEDYDPYSDEAWLEQYDEKRQDIDGGWYTRRQFYDYYGSDDTWDNLDPSIYHPERYDDHYHCWVTKEECYQHYGSDRVWKRLHPIKVMKRKAIWDAYTYSHYVPESLRAQFINRILETYE